MVGLRSERIEAKPKRVIVHDEFTDECGVSGHAQLKHEFYDLLDHIENGWEVPNRYYRLGIGKDRDKLLELTGVKHLHLGGSGSDILVYLIELTDAVWVLRIAGHCYLEDEPRGFDLFEKMGLPYPGRRER